MQGSQGVLAEPAESSFEADLLEIEIQLVQTNAVDVRDQNRRRCGNEARIAPEQRFAERRGDVQ